MNQTQLDQLEAVETNQSTFHYEDQSFSFPPLVRGFRKPREELLERKSEEVAAALARIEDEVHARPEIDPIRLQRAELARKAAAHYEIAWEALHSGYSKAAIGRILGREHLDSWFRGRLPSEILRSDPDYRDRQVTHLTIPEAPSTAFSYILGAYAGIAGYGSTARALVAQHSDPEPMELLHKHARELVENVSSIKAEQDSYMLRLGGQGIVRPLQALTNNNTQLAWDFLVTKAEQHAFLHGFFDFCRGTFNKEFASFVVTREGASTLIEQVAIVLKKLGIYARVHSDPHAAILLKDANEIEKILKLGLISSGNDQQLFSASLAAHQQQRPYDVGLYFRYREIERIHTSDAPKSGYEIAKILNRDNEREVGSETVKLWRSGHVPLSVQRLESLLTLEDKVLYSNSQCLVAAELKKRFETQRYEHSSCLRILCEWEGGVHSLARRTSIPEQRLQAILNLRSVISDAELNQILTPYGLAEVRDQFCSSAKPLRKQIKEWCAEIGHERMATKMDQYLVVVAEEAFERGENPRIAIQNAVKEVVQLNTGAK